MVLLKLQIVITWVGWCLGSRFRGSPVRFAHVWSQGEPETWQVLTATLGSSIICGVSPNSVEALLSPRPLPARPERRGALHLSLSLPRSACCGLLTLVFCSAFIWRKPREAVTPSCSKQNFPGRARWCAGFLSLRRLDSSRIVRHG